MENRSGVDNRSSDNTWKWPGSAAVIALLLVVGVGVTIYPMTAQWWSSYHQSKAIHSYTQNAQADHDPGNAQQLALAREYNDALATGKITVGGETNVPTLDFSEGAGNVGNPKLDYWKLLKTRSGAMGRVMIPSIDVDLPIYHGTSDEVLETGVGHLEGTSLPVGGDNSHSVLTAHTGLAESALFDDLKDMKIGENFSVTVLGETLTYEVVETQTVEPDDTRSIVLRSGEDLVTLVTCTPLGINTHRYLVTGERVFPTPTGMEEKAQKPPEVPRFPWWAVIGGGTLLAAGTYIWWEGRPQTRAKMVEARKRKAAKKKDKTGSNSKESS